MAIVAGDGASMTTQVNLENQNHLYSILLSLIGASDASVRYLVIVKEQKYMQSLIVLALKMG